MAVLVFLVQSFYMEKTLQCTLCVANISQFHRVYRAHAVCMVLFKSSDSLEQMLSSAIVPGR